MFDTAIDSDEDVIHYAQEIMKQGASSVIVSLGGEGAVYVDHKHSLKASVPLGQAVNTVGSGDSTVAGMIAGLETGLTIENAFKQAVSAGTATAFNDDLASYKAIEDIKEQVTITTLKGSE